MTQSTLAPALLADIRSLIEEARAAVAATVNAGLTLLYWRSGSTLRYCRASEPSTAGKPSSYWGDSWRPSLVVACRRSHCGTWFVSLKRSPIYKLSHHC